MRSYLVVLLTVWVCLLATARGLLAADCDSSPDGLLMLEDGEDVLNTFSGHESVVVVGVIKSIHSSQYFTIQVCSLAVSLRPR